MHVCMSACVCPREANGTGGNLVTQTDKGESGFLPIIVEPSAVPQVIISGI